jgi:hypothetical protein
MNPNDELVKEIQELNRNIASLTQAISQLIKIEEAKKSKKKPKSPLPPLTKADVSNLKSRFDSLYARWETGNEHEVRNELDSTPLDGLRRFADANNLTVDKKASKEKVLRAILTRFREKKMLFKGVSPNEK